MLAIDVSGVDTQEPKNFGNVVIGHVTSQSSRAISPSANRYDEKRSQGELKIAKIKNTHNLSARGPPDSGLSAALKIDTTRQNKPVEIQE